MKRDLMHFEAITDIMNCYNEEKCKENLKLF